MARGVIQECEFEGIARAGVHFGIIGENHCVSARASSGASIARTCIRFSVSVPVLSVAMTVTEPRASTASEATDDSLAFGQAFDTHRESQCQDGRQSLGDCGHGQRNGE